MKYLHNIAAAALVLTATSGAGEAQTLFDDVSCRNPPNSTVLSTFVHELNERIIACFNYQQKLALEREQDLRSIIRDLETRVHILELSKR